MSPLKGAVRFEIASLLVTWTVNDLVSAHVSPILMVRLFSVPGTVETMFTMFPVTCASSVE